MLNPPRIFSLLVFSFVILQPIFLNADDEPLFSRAKTTQDGVVEKVLQANEFLLKSGQRVWLIGIETPEFRHSRVDVETDQYGFVKETAVDPDTPIEEQVFTFARRLLEGKKVKIEFDEQRKNEDGEIIAYVFLTDGTLVNAELLRQGFATLKIRPPNLKYASKLREAYQEARREKRGLQGE